MEPSGKTVARPSIRDRIAPFLPWTDGTGRRWRGLTRLPAMIPFIPVYIIVAWTRFILAAEKRDDGLYWIDDDAVSHLVFHVPELTDDPLIALRSLITGIWLNHDSLQLIYVTALLLTFGAVFELHEGTLRMVLLFFGTSFAAALLNGLVLHLVYPDVWNIRMFEVAWNRSWMGGSAGCFGILGAVAARARRPGPLLVIFIGWECAVWWVNLRNYTSAFHFAALATGYIATRMFIPPIRRDRA